METLDRQCYEIVEKLELSKALIQLTNVHKWLTKQHTHLIKSA